jgi:pimeloyl-ACP methyl ester carboxylesterase
VCVYSWGYDADVGKFMSSVGLNTLYRHAQNLLNDLAALQESAETEKLPFIFVAHSLGGLVVKDALNHSAETGDQRLREIISVTFGVCFLGTPHRGSKSASLWRKLFRATEIFAAQRANTQLLQALEKNSETLERITKSFYETLRKHGSLRLVSFCEEKEVRKLGVLSTVIVDPDSAFIGHGNEETGSIPANHSDIVKFTSTKDAGFVRVSNVLRRWVREIHESSTCTFVMYVLPER